MTNYLKNKKLILRLVVFDKFEQAIFGEKETLNIFQYIFCFVSKHACVFKLTSSMFCFKRRGSAYQLLGSSMNEYKDDILKYRLQFMLKDWLVSQDIPCNKFRYQNNSILRGFF